MKLFKQLCFHLVSAAVAAWALILLGTQLPAADPPQLLQPDIRSSADLPPANPADVSTITDIVKAFYRAISVSAGGKLDRLRLHSLFVPSGRIVVGLPPSGSRPANVLFLSLDQYADSSDTQTAREGFFDENPANRIEQFGVMAHVYSVYESRAHLDDTKPMARGIKSFELLHRAERWYIVQVYWDAERPDNPLPERFLRDDVR